MFSLVEESDTCINNSNAQSDFGKLYEKSISLRALWVSDSGLRSEVRTQSFWDLTYSCHSILNSCANLNLSNSQVLCFNSYDGKYGSSGAEENGWFCCQGTKGPVGKIERCLYRDTS